ncbi:NAD(P)-dependent oxidoreductase [Bacillus sp. HMF5848]|uniref:NAD(P)-dependent oxidoreductase n=1 Tax=Bacillus sp. HMF5848 TaxID=2495421 RepID=UPI000F78F849|nr:NAD(P)-dependent oxidoreductase [Bacillus sp. HMF5848]RSK26824.1 NAD(P)-dependent oxidoreductase [Bacillus sp. HMF5848]
MNNRIGFIGTGVMGRSMAINLIKAGYEVSVYTRTPEKAKVVIEAGATWAQSPAEIAKNNNVVITIVGYPNDVEEVYLGEQGILHHALSGTYVIDMTTSTPSLAQEIFEEADKRGIYSLDAPVSGGDIGARDARLSIMVGGDEGAFEAMKPIFEVLGQNIVYQGPAGSGQHTKMCNQIAIASTMLGVSEAMSYATKSGLDPEKVLQTISQGAAGSWSLSNLAPRMIQSDFEPGFFIKHFIKDMTIALEEAEKMSLQTPGLKLSKELYDILASRGEENSGTQALYKYYFK